MPATAIVRVPARVVLTVGHIPPLATVRGDAYIPIFDGHAFCGRHPRAEQPLMNLDRPSRTRPRYLCLDCGYTIDAAVADRRAWRSLRVAGFVPGFFSTDPHARRSWLRVNAATARITL
ncbi:hypothetical protein [Phytomonospora endophytica]|uniref:Uncharacterized protein n=1 Tax=Phytomonospora endophytica TaxID=714109 RepID=A0A841FSC6_9ACTN|nr:hypothetical protein [Phytomonospora endophytica]MBB6037713.1 hypothetical protein [Phytomonospora endophytica]